MFFITSFAYAQDVPQEQSLLLMSDDTAPQANVQHQLARSARADIVYGSNAMNPCEDELYRKLKGKPLDEMTDREYEYFQRKDKECSDYQQAQMESEPGRTQAEAADRIATGYTTYLVVGGIIAAASLFYVMATMPDADDYSYTY